MLVVNKYECKVRELNDSRHHVNEPCQTFMIEFRGEAYMCRTRTWIERCSVEQRLCFMFPDVRQIIELREEIIKFPSFNVSRFASLEKLMNNLSFVLFMAMAL